MVHAARLAFCSRRALRSTPGLPCSGRRRGGERAFEKPILNALELLDYLRVLPTDFGYHILEETGDLDSANKSGDVVIPAITFFPTCAARLRMQQTLLDKHDILLDWDAVDGRAPTTCFVEVAEA